MTARDFLVRGLLAGLIAGLAAFFVGYLAGEPHIETAISIEEAAAAAEGSAAPGAQAEDGHTHTHADVEEAVGTEVSRHNQRTWGLLTATLSIGLALGGILALVAAAAAGRIGRLSLAQSTTLVTALGFGAAVVVPFLKYPATPPAVGNPDTIGARTSSYFLYLLISVVAAAVITVLAVRLQPRIGTYAVVVGGVCAYLVVVVAAGLVLPTVNEIGDFPADVLWYFRRSSLLTQAALWGVLGAALVWLLGRREQTVLDEAVRRELATSL